MSSTDPGTMCPPSTVPTTVPTAAATARTRRRRSGFAALVLPLAALSLTLSACASGEPAAEPTDQETTVQSATPQPSPSSAPASPTPPPASAPASASASASASAPASNALLTISIKQDAAAEPAQYVLECIDGAPGPATTLPGADAACARLSELGAQFFTARPNKDVICTQQYGGPQTASITGEIDGTSVLAAFALTDGCEISRWNSVRDILGAPGT
ncbi:SSI family serine proteinase inhibitor [Arthrobacter agilis]|uniref:SSI family serine proteinase inhibitor n=1 Tax=Arthrobacter agilis TaxID=37921 RepID=UPI00236528A1|nr:SSI family serine proteinase inhibitor [Arthrobacter agilis]WDF33668.1 SSI family serine proteinase inhibitor [Arthrobacter agilis]